MCLSSLIRRPGNHLLAAAAMLGCTSLVATGCDQEASSRAAVSGLVFADGTALEAGIVRFVPIGETKGPVVTASVADGFFSLPADAGPVVGRHRVEIQATEFLGFDLGDEEAFRRTLKEHRGRLPRCPVPPLYGANSPLTAEIPPGGTEGLEFLLTARGAGSLSRTRSSTVGFAAAAAASGHGRNVQTISN